MMTAMAGTDVVQRLRDLNPYRPGLGWELTIHEAIDDICLLEDVLADIWLYVDWRYVTKQMSTENRERWLKIVMERSDLREKSWAWWRKVQDDDDI